MDIVALREATLSLAAVCGITAPPINDPPPHDGVGTKASFTALKRTVSDVGDCVRTLIPLIEPLGRSREERVVRCLINTFYRSKLVERAVSTRPSSVPDHRIDMDWNERIEQVVKLSMLFADHFSHLLHWHECWMAGLVLEREWCDQHGVVPDEVNPITPMYEPYTRSSYISGITI